MATQKNLLGTRIETDADKATVTLAMTWADSRGRDAEAGTFRIAASIAEMSLGKWAISVHANPGYVGQDRLGTYITIELVTGDAKEIARAVETLRAAVQG